MLERIGACRDGLRDRRTNACSKIQKRFGGFAWQMICDFEQLIFACRQRLGDPLRRYAVTQQRAFGDAVKRLVFWCCLFSFHVLWNDDFLHTLSHLDELRRAGLRMNLQPPPLRPLVCRVVVIHIAKQEARARPMHHEPQVARDADRPEVWVFGFIKPVKLQARVRRVQLQVEGSRLRGLLLVTGQPREAAGERVCNPKLHDLVLSSRGRLSSLRRRDG